MERKKSFALGYSLVLHSLLTYLIYGATAVTGLNIIVPAFSKMNGLDQNAVLAANTIHNRYFYLYKFQQLRWESLYGL